MLKDISTALDALKAPAGETDVAFIGALMAAADKAPRDTAQLGVVANADYTLPLGSLTADLVKACEAFRGDERLSKAGAFVIDVLLETMPLEGHASRIHDGLFDSRLGMHRTGVPARAKMQAAAWIVEALGHRCDHVVASDPRKLRNDFVRLDRLDARPTLN